ncbi:oligosaccharide flippase family protein [Enterococcus casseliflavus]|uniref:oligosaccharide flippase family protein n=1 Tax=Enterococcus casseliflavus TaxID=37734 RepID=UPI0039A57A20
MKKIIHNIFYQGIYQLVLVILPVITIPIVSRALGPEGLGLYNYINSVMSYFLLVAGFGIANYGVREIARVRDNKMKLSRVFFELEIFNSLIGLFILIIYLFFSFFMENSKLFFIQSLVIIGTIFDISWFFNGLEEFKSISLSTLFIKLISFFLIYLFIQDEKDLILYFIIQSVSILSSQIILWCFLRKKIVFVKVTVQDCFSHFKPSISYFISKIAITLYTNMNKTLLGLLVSISAVGFYSNGYSLIFVISSLLGTVDMVLLPKMSNMLINGKEEEMANILYKSIHIEMFLYVGSMFGLLTISSKLIPWFFGDDFLEMTNILMLFSLIILVKPLGVAILRQYLIPLDKMKTYNYSVIIGAVVNCGFTICTYSQLGVYSAVIGTILAEFFVTFIRIIELYKETSFRFDKKIIFSYFLSGGIMFLITSLLSRNLSASISTTILQIIIGLSVYLIATFFLKVNPFLKFIMKG